MKQYLVFDGRYPFDPDRASVMEAMGELPNDAMAIREFRKSWVDTDCVLVSYDCDENDNLTNPDIIDSIY